MKHIFTLEIPEARDGRDAYRQLQQIGVENRLGEFVTQVARVDERPATKADWREALRGKKGNP